MRLGYQSATLAASLPRELTRGIDRKNLINERRQGGENMKKIAAVFVGVLFLVFMVIGCQKKQETIPVEEPRVEQPAPVERPAPEMPYEEEDWD